MKIAIYFNHYNTLGHSSRVLGLVRAIKRYMPATDVFLLEGGRTPSILPLKQHARHCYLPYSAGENGLLMENARDMYARMIVSPEMVKMKHARQAFMRSRLKQFRPDILITEYFPFGEEFWTFEVPELLDWVKSELDCRIVCSSGYLGWTSFTDEHFSRYYDQALIHSPRLFALKHVKHMPSPCAGRLVRLLADFKEKIHFTGFMLDGASFQKIRPLRFGRKGPRIFVSRGGGIVGREVIVAALKVARLKKDWHFMVCCGPATGRLEMGQYRKMSRGCGNVNLVRELRPDIFDRYMAAADVCVNMSGYNTVYKLLRLGKRTVVVPFSSTEQCWRAELLPEYLPAVVLSEGALFSPDGLCHAMERVLSMPASRKPIPPDWFDGAVQTTRILGC